MSAGAGGGAPPNGSAEGGEAIREVPGEARAVVPSRRLVGTLATAGALAGLLIVLVHQWAEPRIHAHRAEALRAAIREVLAGPERYETVFIHQGAVLTELPAGVDSAGLDRFYQGYDAAGRAAGLAITAGEPGFQDVISLIFGYDPATRRLIGMRVLEHKETPGLGDAIVKDSAFVAGFDDVATPLAGVKPGAATGSAGEVEMITGATISSRAIVAIINRRLESLDGLIHRGRDR